jgi:hypothetical protein
VTNTLAYYIVDKFLYWRSREVLGRQFFPYRNANSMGEDIKCSAALAYAIIHLKNALECQGRKTILAWNGNKNICWSSVFCFVECKNRQNNIFSFSSTSVRIYTWKHPPIRKYLCPELIKVYYWRSICKTHEHYN